MALVSGVEAEEPSMMPAAAASVPGTADERPWQLDAAVLRRWADDGLVKSPWRLDADTLADMRDALDTLLRANVTSAPESLVCPHLPNGATHPPEQAARWLAFARHAGILDLVSQLIGPDVILWGSQVFCKPAGTGRALPWHQDGHYWPIRPLATCSVWIALDNATPDNGCLRWIPGSHRGGHLHEHRHTDRTDVVLNDETAPTAFDASNARDNVLEAGEFSLHDVFLIHGSEPNRSAHRRAGFVLRYMPATSHFEHALGRTQQQAGGSFSFARRPLWLVRGIDRAGNDFGIGHGEDFAVDARVSDDL
jgi:hypothetical protein